MAEKTVEKSWIGVRDEQGTGQFTFVGSGSQVPQAMLNPNDTSKPGDCASVFGFLEWLQHFDCETSFHYVCEAFLN